MLVTQQLQSSRFELKYVIGESCARAVRDFALSYLVPDEHADPAKNCEYPVHSLYLDSPSLALARATMQGHKNRFKLRIRFYDDDDDSPAFLEIKRRENAVIKKQRVMMRKSSTRRLLAGHWPTPEDIIDPSPKGMAALQEFTRLRGMLQADGQAVVSYMREAYVTPNDNSVRLTFDRRLLGYRYDGTGRLVRAGTPVEPRVGGVILELKFTDRFPVWMRHMVRSFSLVRRSMAKYVVCVLAMRAPQLDLL